MQTKEKSRDKLLDAYESLHPAEQALLQLCSVIYEPVSIAVLYNIFRKSGLGFPGEKISSAKSLEPHLKKLKALDLLDDNCQVPREIVEIVTRRALAAGRIYDASSIFEGTEFDKSWTDKLPAGRRCISGAHIIFGKAFMAAPGPLCPLCAESELKILAGDENVTDWPVKRIMDALSPGGDIRSKLTVIWKFDEAQRSIILKSPGDENALWGLLVENLGYLRSHPLASAVQQAALRVCSRMGQKMLALLLNNIQKDPWPFYVNVLTAMWLIAPEKPQVQAILKGAAADPNPEIRRRLMDVFSKNPSAWAAGTIEKLCKDEDYAVRDMARRTLAALNSKRGRGYPIRLGTHRTPTDDAPIGPTIRFGPLARAVLDELPRGRGSHSHSSSCPRLMRDLRIGIYARDENLFRKRLTEVSSVCGMLPDYWDSITRIFNDPFDSTWFATLPQEVRIYALSIIFHQSIVRLEPDSDALGYAMKDPLFKSAPGSKRAQLLYTLASRLIMGGRLKEAQEIIPRIEGPDFTFGLMGWLRFVEGRNDEAIDSFEADLKELRRRLGRKNINFSGIGGFFFILALLKSQDEDLQKKAEQLVSLSLSSKGDSEFRLSVFRSLKGIIHSQKLEVENAKKIIAGEPFTDDVIPTLFNAIAYYWVNGRLTEKTIDRIDLIFHNARDAGMNWVAMECAALLIRTDEETPIRREFLHQVMQQSGMRSLVSSVLVEEPWEKGLRALIQIGNGNEPFVGEKSAAGTRLIWLVGYHHGEVSVQPVEQRLTSRGHWSKGRPVSMNRIFNHIRLDYISQQDLAICAALRREYYDYSYSFDMDKLLPAIVGHPLLFREESPSVQVEFAKGDPEILVAKSGNKLKIKFAAEFDKNHFMVSQETPTRFKVIELTEKHRRIAQILGNEGLIVPASATQEVLTAITALSSHVLVHSDIGGKSKDVVEVISDPTPHVHLIPSGLGFRVELFVKPFKDQGGPYLKPAVGARNVIAEVGGKRMQTERDLKAEEKMADAVDTASPTLSRFADSDRQCFLENPEDCLQVLLDLKALQENGRVIVEWPEGEKLRVTREVSIDRLRMNIRGKVDWFEVSGELSVDHNLVLDMKRLLELLNTTGTRFIPLEEGHFLALTSEFRQRLQELDAYAEKKGKEIRLHPLAALAVQDLLKAVPNLEVDEAWKSRLERIRVGMAISPLVPSTLQAELREYQVEGFTWLARLAHMGIGACLADDMGLGKTIQALAVILHRAARGPTLVVAPTSVCWNWVAEADRFSPTLNMVQFNGNNNREGLVRGLKHHDVLVTSYGLLIQETDLLSEVDWNTIVLDEAQAIKNVLTRRSQAAMGLKGNFRIVTTGTPIENHLSELWTLFSFINPGLLGSLQKFNERFAVPIEKYNNRDARRRLKRLIQPFILRRLKSQVLEELPPRTEVVLQVEMSPEEAAFYEALRRQALEKIEADKTPIAQKHLKILAEITKLRQAACNPKLVMSETTVSSSKLELLGEVVSELLENRHKALVFSQFVGHLSLIREYLDSRNISYRYIDGGTPSKERKKEVDGFQSGEGDLFLISLKAGGLGLNLTAADYVIHMDPWWNPAVEDQASDRAHRIGQQRPVTIYRLVTKGTIEEKIVKLHQEKRDLAGSLLDGSDISGRISADELIRLISEQ